MIRCTSYCTDKGNYHRCHIILYVFNSNKPTAKFRKEYFSQVTMLDNNDLDHPKIKHFRHGLREFDLDNINMFEGGLKPEEILFNLMKNNLPILASKIFEDPAVKDLYSRRKEFDLLVIDGMFNDVSPLIFILMLPTLFIKCSSFE